MRQFNGSILSSQKNDVYSTRIWFTGLPRPVAEQVPNIGGTDCLVRCACEAYYFWFIYANSLVGGQIAGNRFVPYVRKTPPPPQGRPYANPRNLPGVCKHLIFLMNVLRARELIR